jgi:hypothetical protein
MESTQFEVRSSIGFIRIVATARNRLNILSLPNSTPSMMATIEFDDRWEPTSTCAYSALGYSSTPAPTALVDELVTLGRDWAIAHPEEFERAGTDEFSSIVSSFDEAFDRLVEELQETENGFREVLDEPEFKRQAPAMLRSRIEDAAKMVHAMKLQVEAAAEAIDEAACEESDEGDQH